VAFHVEVSRSFRRAQAFNLSEAELRARVLLPWSDGSRVEIGDREWDPRRSELRVLEGPELDPQQLSFGQGWNNAARTGRDVTRELLAPVAPAIAVLAESAAAHAQVASLVEGIGLRLVDSVADARAAVVVPDAEPTAERAFELGTAVGALGGRVVVALLGDEPAPAYLARFDAIRLSDASQELAERLRRLTD
jgi:hypothetical protein